MTNIFLDCLFLQYFVSFQPPSHQNKRPYIHPSVHKYTTTHQISHSPIHSSTCCTTSSLTHPWNPSIYPPILTHFSSRSIIHPSVRPSVLRFINLIYPFFLSIHPTIHSVNLYLFISFFLSFIHGHLNTHTHSLT
jgi:hypothetical protein